MRSIATLSIIALAAINSFKVDARPTVVNRASLLATTSANVTGDPRADAVRQAFLHGWNGYVTYAFGHDELLPVSKEPSDSRNGWGATIFDALDTMLIMGLDDAYAKAMSHVEKVNFQVSNENSKTFETTIRYLGGLLAANDLRPDPILRKQALALVEHAIMPAFDTADGIPAAYVNVNTGKAVPGNSLDLAEFGSVQMEMTRLSQVTGVSKYMDIANEVVTRVQNIQSYPPGLYAIQWTDQPFKPDPSGIITISGGGDSYYEYLLKNYLLLGSTDDSLLSSWKTFVDSMETYLQQEDEFHSFTYLADMESGKLISQSGELVCFVPGNIIYGAKLLENKEYADFAKKLMDSCYQIWEGTETHIAPEAFNWIPKGASLDGYTEDQISQDKERGFYFSPREASYDLRPETVESLFYFYRITGDKSYQDKAWKIFQAIEKYCRTPVGYSSLINVDIANPGWSDFQESFLFAETFKYLFLIFSDTSTISLNEWVFNTEAHPFKLPSSLNIQI
ncbi:glycoside hydrolase [Umbelopsis sp. AD052]|nr:glycoside hydrolase [Umbelopsis sp. AD052]